MDIYVPINDKNQSTLHHSRPQSHCDIITIFHNPGRTCKATSAGHDHLSIGRISGIDNLVHLVRAWSGPWPTVSPNNNYCWQTSDRYKARGYHYTGMILQLRKKNKWNGYGQRKTATPQQCMTPKVPYAGCSLYKPWSYGTGLAKVGEGQHCLDTSPSHTLLVVDYHFLCKTAIGQTAETAENTPQAPTTLTVFHPSSHHVPKQFVNSLSLSHVHTFGHQLWHKWPDDTRNPKTLQGKGRRCCSCI